MCSHTLNMNQLQCYGNYIYILFSLYSRFRPTRVARVGKADVAIVFRISFHVRTARGSSDFSTRFTLSEYAVRRA